MQTLSICPVATTADRTSTRFENYLCFVTKSTNRPVATTLNGCQYAFVNTEAAPQTVRALH